MLILGEIEGAVVADGVVGTRRVVVSGAGIAGLATALRLHRAGWKVLVVERAPARRSSGYLVNLLGQGYDAAERLGVLMRFTLLAP
jgi:2-polyprenyl-6-methoxyphenol hydroxylase-like FAD-dependent oxidoreductase